jgi:hypothetical protein
MNSYQQAGIFLYLIAIISTLFICWMIALHPFGSIGISPIIIFESILVYLGTRLLLITDKSIKEKK